MLGYRYQTRHGVDLGYLNFPDVIGKWETI